MEHQPSASQQAVVISRSGIMIIKQLSRHMRILVETDQAIQDKHDLDPTDYDEALEDVDSKKWLKAMSQEIESMYSNQV